jgi:hypothetical protein
MSETNITELSGIGGKTADALRDAGFETVQDIAASTPEALSQVKGFGPARAQRLIDDAKAMASEAPSAEDSKTESPAKPAASAARVAPTPPRKSFAARKVVWAAAAALAIAAVGVAISDDDTLPNWVSLDILKGPLLPMQQTSSATETTAPATMEAAASTTTAEVVQPVTTARTQTPQPVASKTIATAETNTKDANPMMAQRQLFTQGRGIEALREQRQQFAEHTKAVREQARQRHQTWREESQKRMAAIEQRQERQRQERKARIDGLRRNPDWHRPFNQTAWTNGAGNGMGNVTGNASGSFGFSMNQRYQGYGTQQPVWGYAPYPYAYPQQHPAAAWQTGAVQAPAANSALTNTGG